jgi:hypothetical protein
VWPGGGGGCRDFRLIGVGTIEMSGNTALSDSPVSSNIETEPFRREDV